LEIRSADEGIADSEEEDKMTTEQPREFEVNNLNNDEAVNNDGRPRRKAALRGEEL
jgi:hypothetical protein